MFLFNALIVFLAANLLYAVVAHVISSIYRYRYASQHACEKSPRLPYFDRLFGLDIIVQFFKEIQRDTHLSESQKRFEKYGNTHTVCLRGSETIFTCEPENIKAVLATQFENFVYGSRRKQALQNLLGPGIFSSDGEEWKHSRRLVKPTFGVHNFSDTAFLEFHAKNLVFAVQEQQKKYGCVDLQRLFSCYTLDTSTDILLGKSGLTLLDPDSSEQGMGFGAAFDRLQARVTSDFVLGPLRFFRERGRADADREIIYKMVDEQVQEVLAAKLGGRKLSNDGPHDYVLLEELMDYTTDPIVLRCEALNLLAAGRGTTASLLSSLWFTLAREPLVFARLLEEVRQLEGKTPDFTTLKSMKYLQACIEETLRLFPPIPINQRTAIRDTVLPTGGGKSGNAPIFVKAGSSVAYYTYALHRRVDLWGSDAAQFRPERWEGLRKVWEFLPFNGGPRLCLGQQLALMEAGYATVRLLQEFTGLEACQPDETWKGTIGFAVTIAGGVRVRLSR